MRDTFDDFQMKIRSFCVLIFFLFIWGNGSSHAQSNPSPFTTGYRYNIARQLTGTISSDPDGAGSLQYVATRTTYDAAGRPAKVETGELANWQAETVAPVNWAGFTVHQTVDFLHNALDQKIQETASSGGTVYQITQYSYDMVGRLECTAVRMNPAAFGALPSPACTLGTAGTNGPDRITKNVYDAAGQLIQIRKAVGTSLEQAYVTYSYTLNGKQEYVIDANGNKAKLEYDGFDRQVKWIFPSKTKAAAFNPATQATALSTSAAINTADYEQYAYDANGNRTSLRKRDGSTIAYQYDALNRVTKKTVPERSGLAATHTRDVWYGYDLRGLQTYARFDSAATTADGVTMAYDGFGRMTSSALRMDGAVRTLAYAWDKNGNRTELTWPDGQKTSYAYDGLDRMTVLYQGASGSTTNMVNYSYNARGLRAAQTGRHSQATSLGYDGIGRLNALSHNLTGTAQDVSFTYAYNPARQIIRQVRSNDIYAWTGHVNVNRAYTSNGLNQYTAAGAASFTYDANGNLTSDGSSTYVYDVENRLVSASGTTSATLRYDPLGRLYETAGGGGATRFLYDGDELVAEYNGSGTLLRRYAHGSSVDDPVLWYEGSGLSDPRWLHTDHQGSIIATTNSSGTSIATNSYDEFGIPASTNTGRFQYTGQAWLPELGMYHYKARIYSPTLGRFLQTDPIGYHDQINLYAYVNNDPVNNIDPSGNCAWDLCIGEGVAAWSIGTTIATTGCALLCGQVVDGARWLGSKVGDVLFNKSNGDGNSGRGGDGRPLSRNDNGGPRPDPKVMVAGDPKSLRQSSQVGDRVKTPDNSPESFTRLKGGQGFSDNKTGTLFQRSNTNHSNSPGGEFKAGVRPGSEPTPSSKVTISGGREGGCVIKKDGC